MYERMGEGLSAIGRKNPRLHRLFFPPSVLVYADDAGATGPFDPKNTVLVLPPCDYWVLATTLNVKSEKEAAAFGPALFDLGEEYRYEARKAGENRYVLIAYDPAELSRKRFFDGRFSTIEKITFAQWLFSDETRMIALDHDKCLVAVDGIVVEIEPSYVTQGVAVPLAQALHECRGFKTLPVDFLSASEIAPRTLKMTLAILLIAMGNLISEAIMTQQESDRLSRAMEEVLERSKLPETSLEREAIIAALQKKEEQQLRMRQQCKKISDMPVHVTKNEAASVAAAPAAVSPAAEGVVLIPGSKPGEPNRLLVGNTPSAPAAAASVGEGMQEVSYEGRAITVRVKASDSKSAEALKGEFAKRFKKAQVKGNETEIEVRIP